MQALLLRIHGQLVECRRGGNFWECFDFHAFRAITVCSILGVRRSVRTERLLVGYKKTKKKEEDEENMMKARESVLHMRVERKVTQKVVARLVIVARLFDPNQPNGLYLLFRNFLRVSLGVFGVYSKEIKVKKKYIKKNKSEKVKRLEPRSV